MRVLSICRWNSLVAIGLILCATSAFATSADEPGATVRLKPRAEVSRQRVLLGDIAEIHDSNPQRAAELSQLDLADCEGEAEFDIELSFVRVRLRLAGHDQNVVRVGGAERTRIVPVQPVALTDIGIERSVHQALCEQFEINPDDLNVRLVSPFVEGAFPDLSTLSQPVVELVRLPQLPLGRCQLMVRVLEGERVALARMASFDISRRQNVVVALASLTRSQVVTTSHVREENRFVSTPVDQLTSNQIMGRKILMPLRPGELVTLRHVAEEASVESPVLVNARDAVRLIARKNGLTVTVPLAEALQSGRAGQLIKVRNIESNRIVTGRVIGAGEVEVPLQ